MVHEAVVRDREEPGGELRARLVARAGVDQLEPHVLEQLLGERRVAGLAAQIPQAPRPCGARTARRTRPRRPRRRRASAPRRAGRAP